MWTTVNPGSGAAHAAAADRLIVVEPRLPPNTSTTGRSGGQVELAPSLLGAPVEHGPRDGPSGDLIARRVLAGYREGEEDAAGEGGAQAIRQAEVGVDLEQRGGDAQHPGGGEHRPGHVAPAAEDDIRAHIAQDSDAPRRRQTGQPEPADERRRGLPRQAGDRIGVERVPGGGHEPRLDPVGRAGERDRCASSRELGGHRQRRHDVARGSACCDQHRRSPFGIAGGVLWWHPGWKRSRGRGGVRPGPR